MQLKYPTSKAVLLGMDPELKPFFAFQVRGTYVWDPGETGGGLDRFPLRLLGGLRYGCLAPYAAPGAVHSLHSAALASPSS